MASETTDGPATPPAGPPTGTAPVDPETGYRTGPVDTDKFPPGIGYIVGNECAERFSFYGMKAILAVFMTEYLMGWGAGERDPVSEGTATEWVHTFVLAAYAFPIIGAVVSDWFLGKYKTILYLSILYCFGHLALALDESRVGLFTGLALIAVGTGAIKPCVSAHVGDQFGSRNKKLLSKVFFLFYFSINFGSAISTVLTPLLLKWYGPSVAFGVPGVLMAIATLLFWLGRKQFAHVPPGGSEFIKESFSGVGGKALLNLVPIYALVAVFWALFDQTASKWVFQARSMDLEVAGWELLPSQIQAANPLMVMVLIPLMAYGFYPLLDGLLGGKKDDPRPVRERPFSQRGLTPLRKIGIGFLLTAGAFAVSALVEQNITGGRPAGFAMTAAAAGEDGLSSAGSADPDSYPLENALDGDVVGRGWINDVKRTADGGIEPVVAVIRLRDRQGWPLSRVEINGSVNPLVYYENQEQARGPDDPPVFTPGELRTLGRDAALPAEAPPPKDLETLVEGLDDLEDEVRAEAMEKLRSALAAPFAPTRVEILTSGSPTGPWEPAGTIEAEPSEVAGDRYVGIDLPAGIEAEYVMLRITAHAGGPAVGLGEVRVLSPAAGAAGAGAAGASPGAPLNVAATGFRPNLGWQLLAYLILTAGEVMVSITCLEFSYTQAPNRMKSIVMAVYLLSVASGNFIVVLVNLLVNNEDGTSKLPGASYYWFFTGLMLAATVVYLLVAALYRGREFTQDERADLKPDLGRDGQDPDAAHGGIAATIADS